MTHCSRDAWIEAIRQHCSGGAKAVSGGIHEKNAGVHIESEKPAYPGDSETVDITPVSSTNQCVDYECTGNVIP